MHMVAARLGCQKAVFKTRWANYHPGQMNRFRKHYSHLVGGREGLGSEWVYDNHEC